MSDYPQMPPAQPQPVQEGLSDSAASGLAYLTFIPAIIFLVVAPYNQKPQVRFHCWQSIFLAAAWAIIWVALVIVGLIPVLNLVDIVLIPVTWICFLILWIIALVNAFQGKQFRLPLLGAYAAKQAGL